MIKSSGIGTQILSVLKELIHEESVELTLLGNEEEIPDVLPEFSGAIIHWDAPIYSIQEQRKYPRIPEDAILHFPHYNAPIVHLRKTLVVVHDLIHLQSNEFAAPKFRLYATIMLTLVARFAARIVTVSETSKKELLLRFPRAANKTTVIPNGLNHSIYQPVAARKVKNWKKDYHLPEHFLLAVGIGKKHKNLDFLIRSLEPLWKSGVLKHTLVIAGSGGEYPVYVQDTIAELGVQDFLHSLPYIQLTEMPILYGAAELLIMPSLLEGFGFPVIESMACGTPVLCSNVSSLPEVAGNAALLFDPADPEDLREKLLLAIGSKNMQKNLIQLGKKRAAEFQWKQHAAQLIQLYRSMSGDR